MTETVKIAAGTTVRCNRCGAKGHIDHEVEAIRENQNALRITRMATIEECGHMDAHWMYDRDQK